MPTTKAGQRAVKKYCENNYDRISLIVRKGNGAKIKAYAKSHKESINGFITRVILETIERDKQEKQAKYVIKFSKAMPPLLFLIILINLYILIYLFIYL